MYCEIDRVDQAQIHQAFGGLRLAKHQPGRYNGYRVVSDAQKLNDLARGNSVLDYAEMIDVRTGQGGDFHQTRHGETTTGGDRCDRAITAAWMILKVVPDIRCTRQATDKCAGNRQGLVREPLRELRAGVLDHEIGSVDLIAVDDISLAIVAAQEFFIGDEAVRSATGSIAIVGGRNCCRETTADVQNAIVRNAIGAIKQHQQLCESYDTIEVTVRVNQRRFICMQNAPRDECVLIVSVEICQQFVEEDIRGGQGSVERTPVFDSIEDRIGRQQVVERLDVIANELDFVRGGERRTVGLMDFRGTVVPQGPCVIQDLAHQARGRLDAEIVVQHHERRAGSLVGNARLNQHVDWKETRRGIIGGALDVAAGDQAARAVRHDIDRVRHAVCQRGPCRHRLVHPVSEVIEPSVECRVEQRGRRDVAQGTVIDVVRLGYRHPPIPECGVQGSGRSGICAVDVTDVGEGLDDVGIAFGNGFEGQARRIEATIQEPLFQGRVAC